MNPHDVLIRPLLTEKITAIREIKNAIAFSVHRQATRIDIRRAVEKVFSVKVASVNVMNVRGKKSDKVALPVKGPIGERRSSH